MLDIANGVAECRVVKLGILASIQTVKTDNLRERI
jgi:hypothetical protein